MAYTWGGGNAWDLSKKQAANAPDIIGVGAVGSFASKAIPVAAGVGIGVLGSWLLGGGSKKDATQTTSQAATQATTPSINIEPYGINIPTRIDTKIWQPEYIYNPQIMVGSPSGSIGSTFTSKKDATSSATSSPAPTLYQTTDPSQSQTATPSLTQTDSGMGNIFTYLVIGVIAIAGIYIVSSSFKPKKDKTENPK